MPGRKAGEKQGYQHDTCDGQDEGIPAVGGEHKAGRSPDDAGAYIIEQPVEASGAAFGSVRPDGDDTAGHGVGTGKGEGDDAQARNQGPKFHHQEQKHPGQHQQQGYL